jgi:site-specific DNA-methyltransferase (adenine-specific)
MPTTRDPKTRSTVFSSASDDWPTPRPFFDELDAEFGFVLDVCASGGNRKADAYYGLDHPDGNRRDGLAGDWARYATALGGAVWMNPPYGRTIGAWMAKAAETAAAGATVVCLVPARTDTRWFHDHVLATGAEVRFVRGRLKFGDAAHSAPFASLVVILRPPAVTAAASGELGPVRPEPLVQHPLELGEGNQVRPGASGEQVLHRRAGQLRLGGHHFQRPTRQAGPQPARHRPGVPGRLRRATAQPPVREGAHDVVGGDPGHPAPLRHGADRTHAALPSRGATRDQCGHSRCGCPLNPAHSTVERVFEQERAAWSSPTSPPRTRTTRTRPARPVGGRP